MVDMTLEERILSALKGGPMFCYQVGEAVGLDPFRARAWLETLADEELVTRDSQGRYSIAQTPPAPEAA